MRQTERLLMLYVESNQGYTSCSSLATYLNVSERSIKRYIKRINEERDTYGAYIETVKGLGYKLVKTSPEVFRQYLVTDKKSQDNEKTVALQLLQALVNNEAIKLEELSQELYTSRTSLQQAFGEVKEWLEAYEIKVSYRPHYGISISGQEEQIRKCIVKYFFEESDGEEIKLTIPLSFLTDEQVKEIRELLEYTILIKGQVKNQYELIYLVKFIAVSCSRIKGKYYIEEKPFKSKTYVESLWDESFKQSLEAICDVQIPEEEIVYISLVAQLGSTFSVDKKPSYECIKTIINKTLESIEEKYKVRLRQDEMLLQSLSTHVYNAYSRYYFGLEVENITLDEIKKSYPEAFHYALDLKENIEEQLNVQINRKELGYIAVHFATAIEKGRQITRYRTYIVCDTGFGTTELIRTKLKRFFSEIEVLGACQIHAISTINMEQVDFLLTTAKIEQEKTLGKDVIHVSHILNDEDIKAIEYELSKLYLENYLKALFNEALFYPHKKYKDKSEALKKITDDMKQKGFISYKDQEEIFKREEVASTEISNLVAVPHCICMGETNSIAICTLKAPINWGTTRVKLILVACLNIDVVQNKHVFPFIHRRIQKVGVVNKLCECDTLDKWLHLLMESKN